MRGIAFSLLLLASFAAAVIDVDPKTVGGAEVRVDLQWAVDSGGGSATELSLKTYSFYSDARQSFEIVSSDPHSQSTDANGNPVLVFPLDASLRNNAVSYSAVVRTSQSLDFSSASNSMAYLTESPLVKISSGIAGKAAEVAGGTVDLRKAVELSSWVHDNVKYDGPGYGGSSLDSEAVFQLREGTCDEFSHLLIAMLRSRGIPAKFIAGFVYSGEEWVAHAWVEAAVDGKWVPFDPTFNEAIVLDGTHLKFAEGKDQSEIREEITGRGVGLDLNAASVTRRSNASFSSRAPFQNLFSLTAEGPSEQLGEGSLAVITATVSSRASRPVAAPLSIVAPEEARLVSDRDILVFLDSGESKQVNWTIVLPDSLAEGYAYTFPISIETLGNQAQVNVSARQGGAIVALSSIELSDLSYSSEGSALKLFVVTRNSGSTAFDSVRAVVELQGTERASEFSLASGEERTLEFAFPPASPASVLHGTVTLTANDSRISRPFTVLVQDVQSTPTPLEEKTEPFAERELFLAGAFAMVLIIVLLILFLRRKKAYSELERP